MSDTHKDMQALEAEFRNLNEQYELYIRKERARWMQENNTVRNNPNCYEVMSDRERDEVHSVLRQCNDYITPVAQKWWKDRGWTIHWSEDSTECWCTKD